MKFYCDQSILLKTINMVQKAVSNKNIIPILKGILIETIGDDAIKVSATDLDLTIENIIPAKIEREGSIVVPASLFFEIIRKFQNEEIEVDVLENTIQIKCLHSEFKLVGLKKEEFPENVWPSIQKKIVLNNTSFGNMIKKTFFSASIEKSRGVIVGELIEIENNQLSMVALDGFRLALVKETLETNESEKIIIESRILKEIGKILQDEPEEEINLFISENKAFFSINDLKITVKLLEGEFLNYKEIMKQTCNSKVILGRSELLEGIDKASVFAREEKNNLVKFKIESNKMEITAKTEEGNVYDELDISLEGEPLEIGFNAKYIKEALSVIEDDEIILEFNTNISPCLIKPLVGNDFEYLILPVRINH